MRKVIACAILGSCILVLIYVGITLAAARAGGALTPSSRLHETIAPAPKDGRAEAEDALRVRVDWTVKNKPTVTLAPGIEVSLEMMDIRRIGERDYFAAFVTVRNRSANRLFHQLGWGRGLSRATLTDDIGNEYFWINDIPADVNKQFRESLYPGDQSVELLMFEGPVKGYKYVELVLGGDVVRGCQDGVCLRIPGSEIKKK